MKSFFAGVGAGFLLGLMVAPHFGLSRRFLRAKPYNRRYLWRDSDDRLARCERDLREQMLDKTLADSFPASDPPSSIPDPCADSMIA